MRQNRISGTCEKKGQKLPCPSYKGVVLLQWPESDLFVLEMVQSAMLDALCSATAAPLPRGFTLVTKLEKRSEVPPPERPIAYIGKGKNGSEKLCNTGSASHASNTSCLFTRKTIRFVPEWLNQSQDRCDITMEKAKIAPDTLYREVHTW